MKLHEETKSNVIIKDSIKTFSYSFLFNLFNIQLQKYMHIIYCWGCHIQKCSKLTTTKTQHNEDGLEKKCIELLYFVWKEIKIMHKYQPEYPTLPGEL